MRSVRAGKGAHPHPEKKHFAVGSHLYWELFSQSISMGLMSSIVSAGSVVLQYGINGLGTLTIAGHTAARKLFAFTDMPLISMRMPGSTSFPRTAAQTSRPCAQGNAADVSVLGGGDGRRCSADELWCSVMVQLISGSSEPIVLENGARYLLWNAPFYAVLGVLLCTATRCRAWPEGAAAVLQRDRAGGQGDLCRMARAGPGYRAVCFCEPTTWVVCFVFILLAVWRWPGRFTRRRKNMIFLQKGLAIWKSFLL